MSFLNTKIETERILLIPIEIKYLDIIFDEFTPEITKYMVPQRTTKDNTRLFIESSRASMENGELLQFVIIKKDTEEFLGCCGVHDIKSKKIAFGLWFKKNAQGMGYGKESMQVLKKWVDENIEYEYIKYPVVKVNVASRKIAESLDGKMFKEFIGKNVFGEEMDEVEYRIYRV